MNLSTQQLKTLSGVIGSRQEALKSMVQEHVRASREDDLAALAEPVGDDADQAAADIIRGSDNAAVGRDVRELRELEAASERLSVGEYGVCIDCGEDIAYERLLAQPTATRCIVCQEIYERTYTHPEEPSL